jgi:predicted deacylase
MRLLPSPISENGGRRRETTAELGARFDALARSSDFFSCRTLTLESTRLHRFVFEGPHGGGDPIRIAFFGGIHGDEPAGSLAVLELARQLARNPNLALGYQIYFYPVCNPGGFDAGTRLSLSGKDLNREFWKNSTEPEVILLEREIMQLSFHGLVSLHADDTSHGVYGFVRGAVLTRSLLEPALASAEGILERNRDSIIDGFPAQNGIISQCYDGILTAPPKLENTPFEIILETPHHADQSKQIEACVQGSLAILAEYRKFIAFAADL